MHFTLAARRLDRILKMNLVIRLLDKKELYVNFKYELHDSIRCDCDLRSVLSPHIHNSTTRVTMTVALAVMPRHFGT